MTAGTASRKWKKGNPHIAHVTCVVSPRVERAFWKEQLFLGEQLHSVRESHISSVKSLK